MNRWSGFSFSVPLMVKLVESGMALLECHGQTDPFGRRRVYLRSRRCQRYGSISLVGWRNWRRWRREASCGLFFWGTYRPLRPDAELPDWTWQTPKSPFAVTRETCFHLRRITDGQIRRVLAFLRSATVIPADEFACATLHLN